MRKPDPVAGDTPRDSSDGHLGRVTKPSLGTASGMRRQTAFTLFINSYDEISAAVGYVRRKYGDADVIDPSLYLGRASKKKPSDETDAKAQTAATGGPSAATTSEAQSTSPGTLTVQSAKAADVSAAGSPNNTIALAVLGGLKFRIHRASVLRYWNQGLSTGTMILRGHLFSNTLVMETGLTILVPGSALQGAAPRRVVYLLHGVCGRSGDWLDYTTLAVFAERYPAVYVMPEVARSFYSDMVFGQKFFSYIVDELPGVVRGSFNVSGAREDTAIIGASMGGYGALKCAFSRPEQYGLCGAFSSPCLYLREGLEIQRREGQTESFRQAWGERMINDFESIFGPALEWKPEFEILELARRAANLGTAAPEVFLACGLDDPFHADNVRFAKAVQATNMPHVFHEWEGAHDWSFFGAALERALGHLLRSRE